MQLEFSYPPTNLFIFGSKNLENWIPLNEVNYMTYFASVIKAAAKNNGKYKLPKMIIASSDISNIYINYFI